MTLSPGTRLGPYEILAALGSGGMGEVYRARDTRLDREVAIKVLPAEVAATPERIKRFEKEARAASALNHPNIVTIYEIGSTDSAAYIAMELVPGKTLRELLFGGAVPVKKLLGLATQIANGLASAHEAGIVHRDLKPENLMVTREGLVKILDFGLAKLAPHIAGGGDGSRTPTDSGTTPGVVMGTAGYMSPEQACGHPVDFRSDQFSLGAILYEMATGKKAFQRSTVPDTLSAILHDEPPPIAQAAPKTPLPLRWVTEHCLAKDPAARYASTKDLARDLATVRDRLAETSGSGDVLPIEPRRRPGRRALGLAVAGLVALAGMLLLGRRLERAQTSFPRFRQLTFRGAGIGTARFAPDGQTIVFSSQTEGRPPELFSMRLESPETRSLELPPAQILSISASGEMALLLSPPYALGPRIGHMAFEQTILRDPLLLDGTLAVASLSGGAPREILENVLFADWAPNARDLAVVHRDGDAHRLEFPIGTAVSTERVLLNHARLPRAQPTLAFKDWSGIFFKDAANPARLIPGPFGQLGQPGKGWLAYEIAWAADEIWYTIGAGSADLVGATEIHAVTPTGRDRLVAAIPGDFILYDVAADGRVLLGRLAESRQVLGSFPGEPRERNLSYFDSSVAFGLSAGGDSLLFMDAGRTPLGGAYIRSTDGSTPRRLAENAAYAISPDGKLVLGLDGSDTGSDAWAEHLAVLPTGAGETRKLEDGGVGVDPVDDTHAGFFPDGKRVFFPGAERNHGGRVWVQEVAGGKPRPITPERVRRPVLVGDGHYVCARAPDLAWYLYPVDETGEPLRVIGILPGEEPIHSTPDGLLYVRGADELRPGETVMTTRIYRVDPGTGRRELWKEIPPADPRTGGAISTILFSSDGKTCIWTHMRYSTELVLAEGLR